MPDYAWLKAEIAKPDYNGMTDQQIAAALNAPVTIPTNIGVGDVEGYLRMNLRISALQDWIAVNSASAGVAWYAARELLGILAGKDDVFQTSNPTTRTALQNMFAAIVAAGAGGITQTDSHTLFNLMASRQSTLAAEHGFGPNSDLVQEIAAARFWES